MREDRHKVQNQKSEKGSNRSREAVSIPIPTGFDKLDDLMGGFSSGDLVILGGRPSSGKTALAIHFILQTALERRIPTLLFSLEMSKEQISNRMFGSMTGITIRHLVTGRMTPEEWPLLTSAANTLSKAPISVNDSADISIARITEISKAAKKEYGTGLIIVDYIQLVEIDASGKKEPPIEYVMKQMRDLAMKLEIPLLILSQIGRECTGGNGKPTLKRLNFRGNIEPFADKILFIHWPEDQFSDNPENSDDLEIIELILAKNINGSTGALELGFRRSCGRFEKV